MIRKLIFSVSVLLLTFSCQEEIVQERLHPELIIKTGTVCGWCSLNDTLTIAGNTVRYVNYTQCNNSEPAVEKNGQLINSELETLLAQLNVEELQKIDLNSCNICFDGCDDWIFFDNGTVSHYIRFSRNDPKLQPIQKFIDQLNTIRIRMQ